MINVDVLYSTIFTLSNKNQSTGYLSPTDFQTFTNLAQIDKLTQDFRIFQETQKITDDLRIFLTKVSLPVDANGLMLYPTDYVYYSALRAYDTTGVTLTPNFDYSTLPQVSVKPLDSDKIAWRLSSQLFQPTLSHPFAEFISTGILIYPKSIGSVILEYLRKPVDAVWAYTIDPTTQLPVYDATNSVDLEWGYSAFAELVIKVCRYFGISVSEEQLQKATQQLQEEGV